jgi:hypothetical protein
VERAMFRTGQVWNDVSGKPIEAHLGGAFADNGVYYWCGMNWDGPTIPPYAIPNQSFSLSNG